MMCIFFYVQKTFPTFGEVNWKTTQLVIEKINAMIVQLGDNFDSIMTSYFEDFKKSMKERSKILVSLVEQHSKDVWFLVDTNFTYVQVVLSRVIWLKVLPYEVNIHETSIAIITLLKEEVDKNAPSFWTFEEEKARITSTLLIALVDRNKTKIMKRLIEEFGEGDEEEEDEQVEQGQGHLKITQG